MQMCLRLIDIFRNISTVIYRLRCGILCLRRRSDRFHSFELSQIEISRIHIWNHFLIILVVVKDRGMDNVSHERNTSVNDTLV